MEFSDTDMAGIMHFANFFRFMEGTETAFLRSLGLSIDGNKLGETIGWPRVHAQCEFIHPLCFEDLVEVHLLVREKSKKSIVYTFIFRNLNEQPAREVARGTLVVVCVRRHPHSGAMTPVPIPQFIADKIQTAPPELLEPNQKRSR